MAGIVATGIKWTAEKLSSLLPSAAASSPFLITPSELSSSNNSSAYNYEDDLRKLERSMRRIQAVLMDAGERDVGDQAERLRLRELKEIAYDAEDVVGEYEYEVLHAKIQARNRMLGLDGGTGQKRKRQGEVIDLDSITVTVPVSSEIASRVKEIRERFEETTRDWKTLGWNYIRSLRHIHSPNTLTRTLTRPPSSSLVHEATIHGRDEDKEIIIRQLISDIDQDGRGGGINLKVHAIVGMGGIGKTTLAQLVYNDSRIRERFELKGWVCVSDEFDVVTLTRKIITSFTKKSCEFTELDDLQVVLQEEVKGKSFVLVLDDVWNEEETLWDVLKLPLSFARSGTVLVTSRSAAVAKVMQTNKTPCYKLGYLGFKACCSLFNQLVFDNYGDRNVDAVMMQVAEKIVTKCNGLPLAVKAIGSVCRIEYDVKCWTDILESEEWKPNIRNGDCLPVLKLSYDRMPPPLKQCFAFLALFPKDYVFHADKIIKLWMAVGLIHGSKGKKLEDIARDYIDQLIERSMIQRIEKKREAAEQEQVFFVMHDLLHDLAELVSGNEVARRKLEISTSDSSDAQIQTKFDRSEAGTVRYLSIVATQEDPDTVNPHNATLVEILRHFHGSEIVRLVQILTWETAPSVRVEIPHNVFVTWTHVRALDFSHAAITTLPESIGNLKLLHYLNVSNTDLEYLPNSTFSLYNLQTLELNQCPILKLPSGIGQLVNLRHLNNDSEYPCRLPYGVGLLTNLQSLKAFVIGKDSSECNIGELKNLVNLRGSLSIFGLNNVSNIDDAKEVKLRRKGFVERLTLNFRCDYEFDIHDHDHDHDINNGTRREFSEELLEILEPNRNVTELNVCNYGGSRFPSWLGEKSFSKLVKVKLAAFHCKSLPPLGQLPSLKYLEIQAAYNVRRIGDEFFGCIGTSALSQTLTTLVLMDCVKLSTIVTLPSLSHLGLFGKFHENLLQNSHLPQLKTIVVSWSHEVTALDLTNQNVEALNIYGCASLEFIHGLKGLTSLKRISITMCPQLYIDPEEHFPASLDRYEVRGCGDIDYISKDYRPGNELPDDDLGVRINMMSL